MPVKASFSLSHTDAMQKVGMGQRREYKAEIGGIMAERPEGTTITLQGEST